MNKYIATFYTHYGAMKFGKDCKKSGIAAKQMPVPRKLSSSCGTCVFFESEEFAFAKDAEDLENCYLITGKDEYRALFENN